MKRALAVCLLAAVGPWPCDSTIRLAQSGSSTDLAVAQPSDVCLGLFCSEQCAAGNAEAAVEENGDSAAVLLLQLEIGRSTAAFNVSSKKVRAAATHQRVELQPQHNSEWTPQRLTLFRLCAQHHGTPFDSVFFMQECSAFRAVSEDDAPEAATLLVGRLRVICQNKTLLDSSLKDPDGMAQQCLDVAPLLFPEKRLSIALDIIRRYSLIFLAAAFFMCHEREQAEHSTQAKEGRMGTVALSGLRAGITFWIFMEHYGIHTNSGSSAFICLAGCVLEIGRAHVGEPGAVKPGARTLRGNLKFLYGRYWRLLPLYFVVKAHCARNFYLSTCVDSPLEQLWSWPAEAVKWVILHPWQDSWPPSLWFVPVVSRLYALFPVIEWMILGSPEAPATRRKLLLVTAVLFALKLAWMKRVDRNEGDWFLYASFVGRIPEFATGMLLPHLVWRESPSWFPFASDAVAGIYLFWAFFMPFYHPEWSSFGSDYPVIAFVMWGLCFGSGPSLLSRLFQTRLLVEIGKYGYGVYLFQSLVMNQLGEYGAGMNEPGIFWEQRLFVVAPSATSLFLQNYLFFPVVYGLTLLLAWAGYHLVEDPGMRFGRWSLSVIEELADTVARNFSYEAAEMDPQIVKAEQKKTASDDGGRH